MEHIAYVVKDMKTGKYQYYDTHFGCFEDPSFAGYSVFSSLRNKEGDDYVWDLDELIEHVSPHEPNKELEIVEIIYEEEVD